MKRRSRAEDRLPDPRVALAQELRHALALLEGRPRLSERAAHEFRRSVKRARALLRLMREAVGERAYARENRALRDAARVLSAQRDARVLLRTLGRIRAPRGDAALDALRSEAVAALRRPPPAPPLRAILAATCERTSHWRLPRPAWPALACGLERIYRKARRTLRQAEERGGDRLLHEARKQAKHLGSVLAFLEPAGAKRLKKLAKKADRVGEDLGDDHDLAVLLRRARGRPLDPALRAGIGKRRRKLQERALKEARALYRAKPAKFVARLVQAIS